MCKCSLQCQLQSVLGVNWRNLVKSAEPVAGRVWLLDPSSVPLPSFSYQSLRILSKKATDGFFSSNIGKNKLWLFPSNISKLCQVLGGVEYYKHALPLYLLVLLWVSICTAELIAPWVAWDRSRDQGREQV